MKKTTTCRSNKKAERLSDEEYVRIINYYLSNKDNRVPLISKELLIGEHLIHRAINRYFKEIEKKR
jgi:hypothetical protein